MKKDKTNKVDLPRALEEVVVTAVPKEKDGAIAGAIKL